MWGEKKIKILSLTSTIKDLASYQKLMVIYFKSFNQVDEINMYISNNCAKYLWISYVIIMATVSEKY